MDVNTCFCPFTSTGGIETGPWLPFSNHSDDTYDDFKVCYRQYTGNGGKGKHLKGQLEMS